MKLFKILPILFLLFFSNCSKIITTPEDEKSIEEVRKFYGGNVETMKGVENFNGKTKDYIELTIKDSELINKQPIRTVSNAANIAFIIFQNQNSENYDLIKVKIILLDGTEISKSFSKKDLQEIKNIYSEIEKFNSFLIDKNYNGIIEMFDVKFKPEDKLVKDLLYKIDSKLGSIKRIQFQGFEFIDYSNLGRTILIREVCERSNVSPFINITFNRKTIKF